MPDALYLLQLYDRLGTSLTYIYLSCYAGRLSPNAKFPMAVERISGVMAAEHISGVVASERISGVWWLKYIIFWVCIDYHAYSLSRPPTPRPGFCLIIFGPLPPDLTLNPTVLLFPHRPTPSPHSPPVGASSPRR